MPFIGVQFRLFMKNGFFIVPLYPKFILFFNMKRFPILGVVMLLSLLNAMAQRDGFSYKFYGFARGDLFVNSVSNIELFDGLFYLYPTRPQLDRDGENVNGFWNTGFYMLTTRFGVDMQGPSIFGATTTAKVEIDFAGYPGSNTMLRLRHSFIQFNWEKGHTVTVGQTWHPLFGEVAPRMMNISTGAPFQPFSRTPQLRYTYGYKDFSVIAAALYQFQHTSIGPLGPSTSYMRNAVLPELYAGIAYKRGGAYVTLGLDYTSIRPRIKSDTGYKVDEWLSTPSAMLAASYSKNLFSISGKTVYGRNLAHTTMLGGYGVREVDATTGAYRYTPYSHASSWLNLTYGRTYRVGVFGGYSKNLGTSHALSSEAKVYGRGLDIDQLYSLSTHFSYNLPHWTMGFEYGYTAAYYGDLDLQSGTIVNAVPTGNQRFMLLLCYHF